MTHRLNRGQP